MGFYCGGARLTAGSRKEEEKSKGQKAEEGGLSSSLWCVYLTLSCSGSSAENRGFRLKSEEMNEQDETQLTGKLIWVMMNSTLYIKYTTRPCAISNKKTKKKKNLTSAIH